MYNEINAKEIISDIRHCNIRNTKNKACKRCADRVFCLVYNAGFEDGWDALDAAINDEED